MKGALDYIGSKLGAKSETEILLQDFTEITQTLLDHSDILKPEIDKFVGYFEGATDDMGGAIDEVARLADVIDKKLIPSCCESIKESKAAADIAEVLAEAEGQLKKSQEMARRREKFLEESNLHLKNIAQQIQEMERKGKREIDLHYQKALLSLT
eukprot:CAMPEP_0170178454 /NCGR_PEP_ID=MMETSP0040_2-20121228/11894_1 /TAXON_ID=641309 /ORGANISM="Lotharella oceanica, Strain CCMP622" /LENGTH=154 /DNA_ID=CAMNT_0010421513 /DNA_START=232 /DNA_END=696 /DNA_ORIENTATION=+